VKADINAGISQDITSDKGEGIALISFKIKDDFKPNAAGIHLKQALLNDKIIWEKDAAGEEGWESIKVPAKLTKGNNQLVLRIYEQKETTNSPIKVWLDDIKIEPLSSLTPIMNSRNENL